MKRKILEIVMVVLLITFFVGACLLDSGTYIPLVITVFSALGIAVCDVIHRKEFK